MVAIRECNAPVRTQVAGRKACLFVSPLPGGRSHATRLRGRHMRALTATLLVARRTHIHRGVHGVPSWCSASC
eukprot:9477927-Pyramimonas_sp.AAC.7